MVRAKRILNFPVIKWDAGDDRSCLPFLSDGEETEKEKEGTSAIDLQALYLQMERLPLCSSELATVTRYIRCHSGAS